MSESLRDGLIRALPYGRRYARALTGNQPEGDLLVAQSLRGLTSQPPAEGFTPLLQLYQAISRLYATDETHRSTQGPGLSSTQRQLLLLTTLEEISVETAAR
ncbi:MAG: response regulator, partial [Acetobacter lovaniensis]|nr:response regulator [Acetobacter lovaniensis]